MQEQDSPVIAEPSKKETTESLPPIPQKRYFTIGEVSNLCAVKPHVLRYWEQEIPQLRPSKRRGNRRYYQYKDVLLAREIRSLLYHQGYTISGAKQKLAGAPEKKQSKTELKQFINSTVKKLEGLLETLS